MLSQIFTRRYPDVSRNPVDLDLQAQPQTSIVCSDMNFETDPQCPIHVERFCDLNTCETFNSAGINRRTTRTFGNYEIFSLEIDAPKSW